MLIVYRMAFLDEFLAKVLCLFKPLMAALDPL
jgi:hypothetical protein